MGVDWIPCRAETGCTRGELEELARREAVNFRANGNSIAQTIDPRICFSEAQQAEIRRAYLENGPLHQRLLLKLDSQRVSVITQEELFPIEWRTDAERTILPWELASQLVIWQNYRDEVARGKHQPFLRQLYIYVQIHSLLTVELPNLTSFARQSIAASGNWATQPDVAVCRDKILAGNILALPSPPRWPDGSAEADLSIVERAFDQATGVINDWNMAVQRGNKRIRLPQRPPIFEKWIAERLGAEWYLSFLLWVEPWKQGGYGLYRDSE